MRRLAMMGCMRPVHAGCDNLQQLRHCAATKPSYLHRVAESSPLACRGTYRPHPLRPVLPELRGGSTCGPPPFLCPGRRRGLSPLPLVGEGLGEGLLSSSERIFPKEKKEDPHPP